MGEIVALKYQYECKCKYNYTLTVLAKNKLKMLSKVHKISPIAIYGLLFRGKSSDFCVDFSLGGAIMMNKNWF